MSSEEKSARVILKLHELQKKKKKLEAEYYKTRQDHEANWGAYGSELCAGDMVRKEDEIAGKIKFVEKFMQRLQGFLGGEVKITDDIKEKKVDRIGKIEEEIARLDAEKAALVADLVVIHYIESVIQK